ncbi:MAG: Hsp20/alpha crystallin family protein [Bacillota bacterium]|jgi:HSP20 family protein|nr:Hsp20/alpha crystallin family protein [Clostridia bacterium]
MSLIPYEPFRHLENMQRELNRFFTNDFIPGKFGQQYGIPNVDIYKTDNEIVASCDIPGIEKKEDINIDIDNNVLTISGTIKRVNEIKEEHIHRQERFIGRFQRSITLPSPVSPENVKATYKNGVLEIRMPIQKNLPEKRIDVQFN